MKYNIKGKFFKVTHNMDYNIKSCEQSIRQMIIHKLLLNFCVCAVGVGQGENVTPFLFSIFLNDLEDVLLQKGNNGIILTTLML